MERHLMGTTTTLRTRDIGDGPVLVLLHAFPCDGRMWEPQAAAAAAAGWRVLVPDLPGFGESSLVPGHPSLPIVAESVIAMVEERGVDRYVVGGVSLGGYVAMELLRARPTMLAGLILCDTKASADGPDARANRERLAGLALAAGEEVGRLLEQAVLPGLLGDSSRANRPEVVERVRGWLHDADSAAVAWYQRAMAERPDSLATIADVDLPTLVVWGEEDALSDRAEQDRMVGAVSDGSLVVVPAAGHLANVEDPESVSAAIVRFLGAVRGPRHA
jgi:pimeloyl-ACP methyl ester carboxylesterase